MEEQAKPTINNRPPIQDQVIGDLIARKELGRQRYGTYLQPFNGRSAIQDLYEELLDGSQYVKQLMVEEQERLDALRQGLYTSLRAFPAIRAGIDEPALWSVIQALTKGLFHAHGPTPRPEAAEEDLRGPLTAVLMGSEKLQSVFTVQGRQALVAEILCALFDSPPATEKS